MQVLVALPGIKDSDTPARLEKALFRRVSGIPLLTRVIATAVRAGASKVLLVLPSSIPQEGLGKCFNSTLLSSVKIETAELERPFDPENPSDWRAIEDRLEPQFLWLPWNLVPDRRFLARLVETASASRQGSRFEWPVGACGVGPRSRWPVMVEKAKLEVEEAPPGTGARVRTFTQFYKSGSLDVVPVPEPPGVRVESKYTAGRAERFLVRRSGKDLDGIFSNFNRWLTRPFVRWLAKTPVTPNIVSFGGLVVAFFAAYSYAQGHWSAYALGGLLFFVAVLFDEMDGMLARIKFRDSAFGCWLESFVDYASTFFLFGGMTLGLYRENGPLYLGMGGLFLGGLILSFLVAGNLRKVSTEPDKPHEHVKNLYGRLEADSGNWLSRFGRLTHFAVKKGVFCHYVLFFSALGVVKYFFLAAAVSVNLVWAVGWYVTRLFRPGVTAKVFATVSARMTPAAESRSHV